MGENPKLRPVEIDPELVAALQRAGNSLGICGDFPKGTKPVGFLEYKPLAAESCHVEVKSGQISPLPFSSDGVTIIASGSGYANPPTVIFSTEGSPEPAAELPEVPLSERGFGVTRDED
jgi:hypothetical protein